MSAARDSYPRRHEQPAPADEELEVGAEPAPPALRAVEASDRLAREHARRSGGEPEAGADADRPRLHVRRQRRPAEGEPDQQRDDHAGFRRRTRASTNASAPSAAATATPTTIQIQADEPPPVEDATVGLLSSAPVAVPDEPPCSPNEAVRAPASILA